MLKENHRSFEMLQRVFDASLASACWLAAFTFRFKVVGGAQSGLDTLFLKLTLVVVLLTWWAFGSQGLYRSQRFSSRFREILAVFKANNLAVIGLVIALYFFAGDRVSRATILLYYVLSTFLFIFTRIMIRNALRALRARGKNLRYVLLAGNSSQLSSYVKTVRSFKDSGIRFLGWIDSEGLATQHEIPAISSKEELEHKPDSIVLSYTGAESAKTSEFLAKHHNDVVPIQILPDLSFSLVGHQIEDFAGIPLVTVNQPTFNSLELALKRALDIFGVVIGGLIISPLLIFCAVGVKLSSPGPIFFGQRRIGMDGDEFLMWKFRSMKIADSSTQTQEWSNKENPRKTKFGDFLRRTSLDELPQLWNVLVGDMSLVGPRPEQPYFVEKFRHEIPGYMLRHKMRAGMTGWAQINGWRGDTDLNERINCDIYYIKNWSFIFDLRILFLTIFKGFISKNAY